MRVAEGYARLSGKSCGWTWCEIGAVGWISCIVACVIEIRELLEVVVVDELVLRLDGKDDS